MRKFIIKNRQKRRYIRRTSNAQSFSFPDLMLISLIPSILIATAYLTTNIHRVGDIAFSYPQIDLTFTLPPITYSISVILNEATAQLSRLLLRIFSVFTTVWSVFLSFITYQSSQGVNVTQNGVESVKSALSGTGEWVATQVTYIAEVIHAIVQDATAWITRAFSQITKSIVYLTGELGTKISSSTSVFFKYVTLPFKAIGGYVMKLYPFYDYFRTAFANAALELDAGLRNVLSIATTLSKAIN